MNSLINDIINCRRHHRRHHNHHHHHHHHHHHRHHHHHHHYRKFESLITNINQFFGIIVFAVNCWWSRSFGERTWYFCNHSKRQRSIFNAVFASLVWCVLFGLCDGSRTRINFTVLAPEVPPEDEEKLKEILPTVDIGLETVQNSITGMLPKQLYDIGFEYHDTNGSVATGPLAAFDVQRRTSVFLGPINDYVIAPVARYASVWRKPVITVRAQVGLLTKLAQYPTLTRMMGSHAMLGDAVKMILNEFNWRHSAVLYYNNDDNSEKGNSKCYFAGFAIFQSIGKGNHQCQINSTSTYDQFKTILTDASKKARVIIICAAQATVREILLAAEELKMIDSGEYVFFSVELYSSFKFIDSKPWYDENDTSARNERAKKAFSALLVVTPKMPDSETYNNFSLLVKKRARDVYNYTFDNSPVSPFVTAFYDAILLCAIAINETIKEKKNHTDGYELTKRMRNFTFEGVTGNVYMDQNGTRLIDFTLLDLNPNTSEFHIVAHYISVDKELKYVQNRKIHWSGGRTSSPPDVPECGFDGSMCADYEKLMFYTLVGLAFWAIVASMVISIVIYRIMLIHHTLKKSGKPKISVGEVQNALFTTKQRKNKKSINRNLSDSRVALFQSLENQEEMAVDEKKIYNL